MGLGFFNALKGLGGCGMVNPTTNANAISAAVCDVCGRGILCWVSSSFRFAAMVGGWGMEVGGVCVSGVRRWLALYVVLCDVERMTHDARAGTGT